MTKTDKWAVAWLGVVGLITVATVAILVVTPSRASGGGHPNDGSTAVGVTLSYASGSCYMSMVQPGTDDVQLKYNVAVDEGDIVLAPGSFFALGPDGSRFDTSERYARAPDSNLDGTDLTSGQSETVALVFTEVPSGVPLAVHAITGDGADVSATSSATPCTR